MFTAALVGRPNVGKSTLFNRIAGKPLALVNETPGMTRDWKEVSVSLAERNPELGDQALIRILDTPGIRDFSDDELSRAMEAKTRQAIDQSDVILFMLDAIQGVLAIDEEIALWLRTLNKPILLLVNKAESKEALVEEAYQLGFEKRVDLSAREGLGVEGLFDLLESLYQVKTSDPDEQAPFMNEKPDLQIGFIGRPNVGKSTLINALIGEDRLITSSISGSTRDAIAVPYEWQGQRFKVIDTAGIRKRSREKQIPESLAIKDSFRTVKYAQVVCLILDATCPLEQQDLTLARQVVDEGRILILIINKADKLKGLSQQEYKAYQADVIHKLENSLSQLKQPCVFYLSALKKPNFDPLFKTIQTLYERWNKRITTAQMNTWLQDVQHVHQPPLVGGRRLKLRFMTQIKTRPPTFVLFCNKPNEIPGSYHRFLENSMRQTFGFQSIPLRLRLKKSDNPYAPKSKK